MKRHFFIPPPLVLATEAIEDARRELLIVEAKAEDYEAAAAGEMSRATSLRKRIARLQEMVQELQKEVDR